MPPRSSTKTTNFLTRVGTAEPDVLAGNKRPVSPSAEYPLPKRKSDRKKDTDSSEASGVISTITAESNQSSSAPASVAIANKDAHLDSDAATMASDQGSSTSSAVDPSKAKDNGPLKGEDKGKGKQKSLSIWEEESLYISELMDLGEDLPATLGLQVVPTCIVAPFGVSLESSLDYNEPLAKYILDAMRVKSWIRNKVKVHNLTMIDDLNKVANLKHPKLVKDPETGRDAQFVMFGTIASCNIINKAPIYEDRKNEGIPTEPAAFLQFLPYGPSWGSNVIPIILGGLSGFESFSIRRKGGEDDPSLTIQPLTARKPKEGRWLPPVTKGADSPLLYEIENISMPFGFEHLKVHNSDFDQGDWVAVVFSLYKTEIADKGAYVSIKMVSAVKMF